jgi:hypothetical protein
MAELATLQGWLTEAEGAKHKLLTGSLRASVTYNGQNTVTFAKTDMASLDVYIASLRSQIAVLNGEPAKVMRPIYFGF